MKTFDEVKESCLLNATRLKNFNELKLRQEGISEINKNVAELSIKNCTTAINNIDEVTLIEIGSMTNGLINHIRSNYIGGSQITKYFNDFNGFMESALEKYPAIGITVSDLECLKGKNPLASDFGDELRKKVNDELGVDIPMSGVVEAAIDEYDNATDEEKDKAYVNMMELKRNAGWTRNGGIYYPLAENKEYLEAKERVSGKSL